MRSFVSTVVTLGLLTGGCGSNWWRDPPAAPTGQLAPPGAGEADGALYSDYPAQADPGAAYPPPARAAPVREARGLPPGGMDQRPPALPLPVSGVATQRTPAYDNVGYASWSSNPGAVAAAHPTLSPGSFAEVTALDSGRTILVPITAVSRPGREIELSGAAGLELGLQGGRAPVRVRAVNPSPADINALQAGRPASARPDTPPVLLNALRRKLDGTLGRVTPDFGDAAPGPAATGPSRTAPRSAPTPKPSPTRAAAPAPRAGPGYYVQLAALSDAARAQVLARSVGGGVSSAGGFHRVRLGPFDDLRAAQAARDGIARRGYGDARIVRE